MKGKILLGLIALLFIGGNVSVSATSNNSQTSFAEKTTPMSSVIIRQDGNTVKSSSDNENTWETFAYEDTHDFYNHEEFSAWIQEQKVEITKLVEAGEWTQEKADAVIQQYYDLLTSLDNGLLISKRESIADDQYLMSVPNAVHSKGFQTMIYTENGYEFFGPYDTEKELYDALKAYTDSQIEIGNMTSDEANTILKKYE